MIGQRRNKLVIVAVILVIVVVVVTGVGIYLATRESGCGQRFVSSSTLGQYTKAAVSTNGRECAQIGADILAKNGSAVDAAIAALLCEGVASLHSMGLGGGFLMTIWDAEKKVADYLDARETAPRGAHKDMFEGDAQLSMYGGLAVSVPGELLGYWEAHRKYGRLNWPELFEPTIALCETGTVINDYLAAYLATFERRIRAEPSLAEILIDKRTNSTYKAGDRLKRPRLAITLRQLADHGPALFYNGTMADDLVREIQAFNGIVTKQDFQEYSVKWRTPVKSKIGKLTIYTAPPPGSGAILAFVMNVLQNMTLTDDDGVKWHRLVETFKWAYARRTELGDPDFQPYGPSIERVVQNLTSTEYAGTIRKLINDRETSNDPGYYGAVTATPTDSGTSHVSVLAPDGSAVSVTSTINQVFGAMIRSRSTGIIFNDEMDDFSSPNIVNGFGLPPSPANFIQPGKRPLSSMTPTIVTDENNDVRLVIGAAGGTKITTGVAIGMVLNLWHGYDVKEAIDAHRLHHQLLPMTVQNQQDFCPAILDYLRSVGHEIGTFTGIGSAITAIAKENGRVTANSDYRREGRTAGL